MKQPIFSIVLSTDLIMTKRLIWLCKLDDGCLFMVKHREKNTCPVMAPESAADTPRPYHSSRLRKGCHKYRK